jgi:putative oxidoreductase
MDTALLLARLLFGLGLAGHSVQKLFGWFGGPGIAGAGAIFETLGFRPGRFFALSAALTELAGAALIVLGLLGPVGPALMVLIMLVACAAVVGNGYFASRNGCEPAALYGMGGVLLMFTGPGRYSLDQLLGLMWLSSERTAWIALGVALAAALLNIAVRRRPRPENTR